MTTGKISKIAGPLVVATGMREANMFDVVRVSDSKLIGEIIEMHGDRASIQVYEETSGLGTGEPVESTGEPLSVELGPGLIEGIFDGIQRPLEKIRELVGNSLVRGVEVPALDREKKWHFVPKVKVGDKVVGGDILGTVQETEIVEHRIMVKPGVVGTVKSIAEGDYTVTEQIGSIETANGEELPVTLMQKWPVRRGRPFEKKLAPNVPLVTGQRVVDTLFPIAKGGVAAIPGPFGSGKTVTQHQLAKWAEADIVFRSHRLRRARQRDDRRLERVPRAYRSSYRKVAHGAHRAYSKHLGYARRRARSVDIHGHHDSGIFQRHGLFRRPHGGLYLPLGGGSARDVRQT